MICVHNADTYASRDCALTNPTTSLIINVPQPASLVGGAVTQNPGYRASSAATLRRAAPPPPPPPAPPTAGVHMAPQSLRVDPVYPGAGDVAPAVAEFPRENLRFVEKLGDCRFGEVCSKSRPSTQRGESGRLPLIIEPGGRCRN